jgi:hypothetical protein
VHAPFLAIAIFDGFGKISIKDGTARFAPLRRRRPPGAFHAFRRRLFLTWSSVAGLFFVFRPGATCVTRCPCGAAIVGQLPFLGFIFNSYMIIIRISFYYRKPARKGNAGKAMPKKQR